MKHKKMVNLLNEASNSKFVTRKWNITNNHPSKNCDVETEIIYNTEVIKSSLCNSDAYILVRANTTVKGAPIDQLAFKNYDHLICVSQKLVEL